MKKGWQTKKLGEVCEIIKGRKPMLKAAPSNGDLPYLVAKVMRGSAEAEYASVKDRNSIIVETDETIIICDGSNSGEVFTGFHGILSSTMGKISKKAEIDDRYLRAFLDSTFEIFNGAKTGSAIPHLDKEAMYRLEFPLPPLADQQRIVGVLDEAFAGLATAQAHAAKNHQNARALFESHLQSVFTHRGKGWVEKTLAEISATFGRGKSKHRPRNAPHLYGGKYPFVQTGDIRSADHTITEYSQTYSDAGLAQSKLWPKGTICITIAANIAETAVLGFDACFPDSVIGLVANPKEAEVGFIEFLLQSFKTRIQAMGKGSAQANINMGTFEHERFPFPPVAEQKRIVAQLETLSEETQRLAHLYERKLAALAALKKSLLHEAFTGELAREAEGANIISFPAAITGIKPNDLHAGVLAKAYQMHEASGRQSEFGHVKAEKIAHMIEAHLGIDLERSPIKDAAGPNDFPHLKRVEHRAKMADFFLFQRVEGGAYRVKKGGNFDAIVKRTDDALGDRRADVDRLLNLMLPMKTRSAEIVATVYAAWNNLLLDGEEISDENIVHEARENWHPDKMKIPREKFFTAIGWMKERNLVPEGRGRKVAARIP